MDPSALCVDVLANALDRVKVSTEMPPMRPDGAYVQVSRTGGEDGMFVDRPIMTLMCWAKSDVEASALAASCVHALAAVAADHPYLSAAESISIGRDEWTATGQSRYMAQIRLTINH